MGSSGVAGGGGAGIVCDARCSIGADARGNKRRRQGVKPDASSTRTHAVGGGIVSAGCGSAYGSGSGYGSGSRSGSSCVYGARSGCRVGDVVGGGAEAGAGAGDGAKEDGEFNRNLKPARVSCGDLGGGSVDGVTDGSDGSGGDESFSSTEGASAAGIIGCEGMSATLNWKD